MQLRRAMLCALCLASHAGAARRLTAARSEAAVASRRAAKAAAAMAPAKPAAIVSGQTAALRSFDHSVASVTPVASMSSHGHNDSLLGRSGSQQCWKANELCESMSDYVRLNGLTHIFVGASAKLAGTTIKNYFDDPSDPLAQDHTKEDMSLTYSVLRQRCQWAIAGSHMYHGLGPLLNQACGPKTLFLLPVREELPWIRSALQQVCFFKGWKKGTRRCEDEACPATCGNTNWLKKALRTGLSELGSGPHNKIREWMVRSPKFSTIMFDISSTNDVLSCLPPGGLKIEDASDLASHVYKRDDPIIYMNDGSVKPPIKMSDDTILAEYNAGPGAYWVQPYAKAIKESGCEAASALRLQAAEGR